MILTKICDLCGWANDNNAGACHHCGGQTAERLVKGRWITFAIKAPTIKLGAYYSPGIRNAFAEPTGTPHVD